MNNKLRLLAILLCLPIGFYLLKANRKPNIGEGKTEESISVENPRFYDQELISEEHTPSQISKDDGLVEGNQSESFTSPSVETTNEGAPLLEEKEALSAIFNSESQETYVDDYGNHVLEVSLVSNPKLTLHIFSHQALQLTAQLSLEEQNTNCHLGDFSIEYGELISVIHPEEGRLSHRHYICEYDVDSDQYYLDDSNEPDLSLIQSVNTVL